jgi:hypothetical protein
VAAQRSSIGIAHQRSRRKAYRGAAYPAAKAQQLALVMAALSQ